MCLPVEQEKHNALKRFLILFVTLLFKSDVYLVPIYQYECNGNMVTFCFLNEHFKKSKKK